MRYSILVILVLVVPGCSDDNSEKELYSQEWILDMGQYLGSTYSISGTTFEAVPLGPETVLINEYSDTGHHLVELNWKERTFEGNSPVPFEIFDLRKRDDGSILAAGYAGNEYKLGEYNTGTLAVDVFLTLNYNDIDDPPGSRSMYLSDHSFYTYNPNVYYLSTEEVYLAGWDFTGSRVWKTEIDPSREYKIAKLGSVADDHALFISVYNYDQEDEQWRVGKITSEGELSWHKQLNDFGHIVQVIENEQHDFFVLNDHAVTKHDGEGNIIWANPLNNYQHGNLRDRGMATEEGGIVVQYVDQNDIILIKIDAAGKLVWKMQYWERNDETGGLGFLELSNGDLLVTSLSGFITKYKLNR